MFGITKPVKEKMQREFSSWVAVGPHLSAAFVAALVENPEEVLRHCSERLHLRKYSGDQVRNITGQKVAFEIFGIEQQRMQKLRKVMVTCKSNIFNFIKARKDKLGKDDEKQRALLER
jgi:hypothetical protein